MAKTRSKKGVTPGGRTYVANTGPSGSYTSVREGSVYHIKDQGVKLSSTKGVIKKSFTKPARKK